MKDIYSFKNSINSPEKLIPYFEDKNHKEKVSYEEFKALSTRLITTETFLIIATIRTAVPIYVTASGLTTRPNSRGVACGLAITKKVFYGLYLIENTKQKKLERAKQTWTFFDSIYQNY